MVDKSINHIFDCIELKKLSEEAIEFNKTLRKPIVNYSKRDLLKNPFEEFNVMCFSKLCSLFVGMLNLTEEGNYVSALNLTRAAHEHSVALEYFRRNPFEFPNWKKSKRVGIYKMHENFLTPEEVNNEYSGMYGFLSRATHPYTDIVILLNRKTRERKKFKEFQITFGPDPSNLLIKKIMYSYLIRYLYYSFLTEKKHLNKRLTKEQLKQMESLISKLKANYDAILNDLPELEKEYYKENE